MIAMLAAAVLLAQAAPLPRAHAHNDYAQARPLEQALSLGFCSIEADVFLVDGELLVAHDRPDVRPDRELGAMYLQPLVERMRRNNGWIHAAPAEVMLLVDIKADGVAAYRRLKELLEPHRQWLTSYRDGKVERKGLTVVLSGDRPIQVLADEADRLAFIDGRPSDLGTSDPKLIPLISSAWPLHFTWRGTDAFPIPERERLNKMVSDAHQHGQKIRFWASPENEAVWTVLKDARVDLIGTDRQPELAEFLRRASAPFRQSRPLSE
jgi:hypothetical protein